MLRRKGPFKTFLFCFICVLRLFPLRGCASVQVIWLDRSGCVDWASKTHSRFWDSHPRNISTSWFVVRVFFLKQVKRSRNQVRAMKRLWRSLPNDAYCRLKLISFKKQVLRLCFKTVVGVRIYVLCCRSWCKFHGGKLLAVPSGLGVFVMRAYKGYISHVIS